MCPIIRIFVGLVFLVSGVEKLLGPYQNFLYVVQAYQILPRWAEVMTARVFPWVELFIGLFAVLGLWGQWALKGAVGICAIFIIVVGQALLRGLPIDQCGCFGELVHVPPRVIIVFDSMLLLLAFMLLRYPSKMDRWSLDKYFNASSI